MTTSAQANTTAFNWEALKRNTPENEEDRNFDRLHRALNDGHDAEPGDEAVGLIGDQLGQYFGSWVERLETAYKLDINAFRLPDGAALDPLTGSQMATTFTSYLHSMDGGTAAVDLGPALDLAGMPPPSTWRP